MPSLTNRFGERRCKVCGVPPWPVCPWCGRLLSQIEESHRLTACREAARGPGAAAVPGEGAMSEAELECVQFVAACLTAVAVAWAAAWANDRGANGRGDQ